MKNIIQKLEETHPELMKEYRELCQLHIQVNELARQYYALLYSERKKIKEIKQKYQPHGCYKKYSRRARAISKKFRNGKKRGQVDHSIIPVLLGFLLNMTPEEVSAEWNLQLISKEANRKKSFLI